MTHKPSEEEARLWAELDAAIQEEKRISENLSYFCNQRPMSDILQDIEDAAQAAALAERKLNPPSFWQRLLGL